MPLRNNAATTPNNATNAGKSSDWESAAANGACRKLGSCVTAPWLTPGSNSGGSAELICDVISAAIPALPSTPPTCRVVL